MAYVILFFSALVAATILPLQSEAVLVALLLAGDHSNAALVAVATVGNVAGSVVNWILGRAFVGFQNRRWFPVSSAQLIKANACYGRYGRWALLLSWLPVIGDPITVAAGALGERFLPFVFIVTLAKAGRYIFLGFATLIWL
jgi:membrane protein YqaA with SNARE-associated domain